MYAIVIIQNDLPLRFVTKDVEVKSLVKAKGKKSVTKVVIEKVTRVFNTYVDAANHVRKCVQFAKAKQLQYRFVIKQF